MVETNTNPGQQATFINLKKSVLDNLAEDITEDFCVTLKESGDWNTYRDCRSVTNKILACNVCQFQVRLVHLHVENCSEELLRQ